jgi:hypothetical protein
MFTTPANAPSVSLSVLTKALGMKQLRMAGPKDMKGAFRLIKKTVSNGSKRI